MTQIYKKQTIFFHKTEQTNQRTKLQIAIHTSPKPAIENPIFFSINFQKVSFRPRQNKPKGHPICGNPFFPICTAFCVTLEATVTFTVIRAKKSNEAFSQMLCESFRRFRNRFDRQRISVTAFYVIAKVDSVFNMI